MKVGRLAVSYFVLLSENSRGGINAYHSVSPIFRKLLIPLLLKSNWAVLANIYKGFMKPKIRILRPVCLPFHHTGTLRL